MKIVVVAKPHGEFDASLLVETLEQLRDKDTKLIFLHEAQPFNEQLLDEFVEWIANGNSAQTLRITDGFDLPNELWYIDTHSRVESVTFMGTDSAVLENAALTTVGLPHVEIEIVRDCLVGERGEEVANALAALGNKII